MLPGMFGAVHIMGQKVSVWDRCAILGACFLAECHPDKRPFLYLMQYAGSRPGLRIGKVKVKLRQVKDCLRSTQGIHLRRG